MSTERVTIDKIKEAYAKWPHIKPSYKVTKATGPNFWGTKDPTEVTASCAIPLIAEQEGLGDAARSMRFWTPDYAEKRGEVKDTVDLFHRLGMSGTYADGWATGLDNARDGYPMRSENYEKWSVDRQHGYTDALEFCRWVDSLAF